MDKSLLKRSYTAAALAAAGITAAVIIYAVIAEALRRGGFRPVLLPPAAYAVKYALYVLGAAALPLLRLAGRLDVKKAGPEETVRNLVLLAIMRAALAEVPALCGLMLVILTGGYSDFYLLLAFAAGLEIYYFPRLSAWEERLRGDFGEL
jgi:protein-S-isoprenylcysteine O-methyltransferase Ste14